MRWRINNYSREHLGVTGTFDVNLHIPPTVPHFFSVTDPNCFGYLYIRLKEIMLDTAWIMRLLTKPDSPQYRGLIMHGRVIFAK